jgi:hypothetical protein
MTIFYLFTVLSTWIIITIIEMKKIVTSIFRHCKTSIKKKN